MNELLVAAQRALEASDKVLIDRDTLQPDYYEWCAAVEDLRRLTADAVGSPVIVYVIVGYYAYEGLSLEAVSLDRTVAETKRDALYRKIGDDDDDPTLNRYRIYELEALT